MANDIETYVWSFLVSKIKNEYGVAALMGNIDAESGVNPINVEDSREAGLGYDDLGYTNAIDTGAYTEAQFVNDKAGYGLCQWTSEGRKQRFYTMYKEGNYPSIGSLELQLNLLWYELENHFQDVLEVLKKATSIREASDKVLHDFESPADQSVSVEEYRESLGIVFYSQLAGTVPIPTDKKKGMSKLLLYAVACELI